MIDELYINGTQIDIYDIEIPRKYVSPYFRNVAEWLNNSTYTVTLPFTATNTKLFEHCMTADSASAVPYSPMRADYYSDGDLIFKDAETKLLGITKEGFEVQFVWGINRNKYLPFFDTKLNEIRPNGGTITETDWVVDWRKANTVYATGKKFKYLNYISGIRESDVFITGGSVKTQVQPPPPFGANVKEMTMHPFVPFNNIIDLACATVSQDITGTVETIINTATLQLLVGFLDVRQGDILKSIDDSGDISRLNIRVTAVIDELISFSEDITEWYDGETPIVFIRSTVAASEFTALKNRLTNKGFILGGNKGNKVFEVEQTFKSNTALIDDMLILADYVSTFIKDNTTNYISISPNVIGNDKNEIVIELDMIVQNFGELTLHKNGEVLSLIPFEVVGSTHVYNTSVSFMPEYGAVYWISATTGSTVSAGGKITISQAISNALYSMQSTEDDNTGYYDCLLNLPEMTVAEFIQNLLVLTGLFFSFDADGNTAFISLDTFKTNLDNGTFIDWSNKVHDTIETDYNINDLAQSNLIKYANADKTTYDSFGRIFVNNLSLEKEKDLYQIGFHLPETFAELIEFILYKQRVESSTSSGVEQISFKNEYQQKNSIAVYDYSGTADLEEIIPNTFFWWRNAYEGFINKYYGVFQDLCRQPMVKEIEVNLNVYEQNRFDFTKPVFIEWMGRYCLVLEITGMRNEVSTARVLIIKNL